MFGSNWMLRKHHKKNTMFFLHFFKNDWCSVQSKIFSFIYNKIKKYDQNCRHETKIKQKCRFYKHQQFLKFTVDGRNRANKTNTPPAKINEKKRFKPFSSKAQLRVSAERNCKASCSLQLLLTNATTKILYKKAHQKHHSITARSTLNEHTNGHPGETKT